MNSRSHWWVVVAAVALMAVAGCNQNSGGDDDDGKGTSRSVTFNPAGDGKAGAIWLEMGEFDAASGTLTLIVRGDGLSLFGIAGRLIFETQPIEMTGAQVGDALAGDGLELQGAGAGNEAGGVFGFSRTGAAASAVVNENQVIGKLTFAVKTVGTSEIEFDIDRSRVVGENLERIEVADWIGGTIVVK